MKKSELRQIIREVINETKSDSFQEFYKIWNKKFDMAMKRKDTKEIKRLKDIADEFTDKLKKI